MPRPSKDRRVYDVDVAVADVYPVIWRLVRIPANYTLLKVHRAIQIVMGWRDYHLHDFHHGEVRYATPHPDDPWPVRDERRVTLRGLITSAGNEPIGYEYDYGDSWECRIVAVHEISGPGLPDHPVCLAGENAGPVEDSGGPWGYLELLDLLDRRAKKEKLDKDDRARIEWLKDWYPGFNPTRIGLADMNAFLADPDWPPKGAETPG